MEISPAKIIAKRKLEEAAAGVAEDEAQPEKKRKVVEVSDDIVCID